VTSSPAPDPIGALLNGAPGSEFVLVEHDGSTRVDSHIEGVALLPGSFNPLHHGHEELARVASKVSGLEVLFELSVVNVDKPPLTHLEAEQRVAQFAGRWRVLLTRAPRFVEKARLFPRSVFVIGVDTAIRLVQPRYYEDSEASMHAALEEMRELGARFLVAGRAADGSFQTLDDAPPPAPYASMFESIAESLFRADVSSTDLRSESTR
jgi:nicotinic acid mononucleotide adenylyltransferase